MSVFCSEQRKVFLFDFPNFSRIVINAIETVFVINFYDKFVNLYKLGIFVSISNLNLQRVVSQWPVSWGNFGQGKSYMCLL